MPALFKYIQTLKVTPHFIMFHFGEFKSGPILLQKEAWAFGEYQIIVHTCTVFLSFQNVNLTE